MADPDLPSNPAKWTVFEVELWAGVSQLAASTIAALAMNQVDGPTLITLAKSDLQTELGITSLPARRHLWELIQALQSEHKTNDFSYALEAHVEEIHSFSTKLNAVEEGPDAASGFDALDSSASLLTNELVSDAQKQRQIIDDNLLAHRLQKELTLGSQAYEDAEMARQEQVRLNELYAQAESDLEYAERLAATREERRAARTNRNQRQADDVIINENVTGQRVNSLFGLCLTSQRTKDYNVTEAFQAGKMKPDSKFFDLSSGQESDGEDDRKPAASKYSFDDLNYIDGCSVCLEMRNVKGYSLSCDHNQCIPCTRRLFRTALGDNSMLPLRCCDLPIDMNIAFQVLPIEEAKTIVKRVHELQATNKMYCPTCSQFFDLDMLDASGSTEITCGCGTDLCIVCKSTAHRGISCNVNQSIQSGSDDLVLELSRDKGWKQCPGCSTLIELWSGCNHMTCSNCRHEFCYNCLRPWNSSNGQCSSGQCEVWEEDRLYEAGEARVRQEEAARGAALPRHAFQERLRDAIAGLRFNEVCVHEWVRSEGYKGECPNCSFMMYAYGMECTSDCGSTVCYTCANHRIPRRGWR